MTLYLFGVLVPERVIAVAARGGKCAELGMERDGMDWINIHIVLAVALEGEISVLGNRKISYLTLLTSR